jgi:integrase
MSTAVHNCTRDEGGPFDFGNRVPISSHRKLLRRCGKARTMIPAGKLERVHDLRRTAATLMEDSGVAVNMPEAILGHNQVASLERPKAAALATLAATVFRIVQPAATPLAA